jgi:hypothetical protein
MRRAIYALTAVLVIVFLMEPLAEQMLQAINYG